MPRGLVVVLAALAVGCGEPHPDPVRYDAGAVDARPRPPDAEPGDARDAGPPVGPTRPEPDVELVLPYLGDTQYVDLTADVGVAALDVHFSVDTTGSFHDEIAALSDSLATEIIPRLRRRVDDVAFGVSRFEDYPLRPFGGVGVVPFGLLTAVTTDVARVRTAVAALEPIGFGGDLPESGLEALYQIATGDGLSLDDGTVLVRPFVRRDVAPGGGDLGGVGFRSGAVHVVVHISDADSHTADDYRAADLPAHDEAACVAALANEGIRVVGVASGADARPFLEGIAMATGAQVPAEGGDCRTGIRGERVHVSGGVCPLVFDITGDGTGLSTAIVDGIVTLLDAILFDAVYGRSDDRLGFVHAIEAVDGAGEPPPLRTDERPAGDGLFDTFRTVVQGAHVHFRAAMRNELVRPADYDQVFDVVLEIVGDGVVVGSRRVRVTVPRGRIGGDAGTDAGADAGGSDAGSTDGASGDR